MIADIALHREGLRDLCRRFVVRRLEVFGSSARGDFDPAKSDIDFLVEFAAEENDLARFVDFKEALGAALVAALLPEAPTRGAPTAPPLPWPGAEPIYAA